MLSFKSLGLKICFLIKTFKIINKMDNFSWYSGTHKNDDKGDISATFCAFNVVKFNQMV